LVLFNLRFAAQRLFVRGGVNMGFGFWFGRTVVFSAGFFIPTSLATVARIGFSAGMIGQLCFNAR
jgi:hypothetical protein